MEEVQDEHGNPLVKIVLVDDNNESTGVAYVSPEDANQIVAGTMTIHSEVDPATGQTVVTLTAVEPDGAEGADGEAMIEASGDDEAEAQIDTKDFTGLDALSHVIDSSEPSLNQTKPTNPTTDQSLDHLIKAANAASEDQQESRIGRNSGEGFLNRSEADNSLTGTAMTASSRMSFGMDTQKLGDRVPLWRPVILQAEHVSAILKAAELLCDTHLSKNFQPEPYSKKLGSESAYQEMMNLMDFQSEGEQPERMEQLRKHSMLFRAAGPNSRALTLYEQAVNEAAAQICRHYPALLFHKRDLAIMGKQCVKLTGIEFPSSRHSYLPPAPPSSTATAASSGQTASALIQNSLAGGRQKQSHTDQIPFHGNLPISSKESGKGLLSNIEISALSNAVMQLSSDLPRFQLKSREQCSLGENYVYTDAVKISKMYPDQHDDEMDYIREVSAVLGRYPSGPRNPSAVLTAYDQAINEAAAWLVRLRPALLTHTRQLNEWSGRAVKASGLQLPGKFSSSVPSSMLIGGSSADKWGSSNVSRSHHSTSVSGAGGNTSAADMMHFRLQGDLFQQMSGSGGYVEPGDDDYESEMQITGSGGGVGQLGTQIAHLTDAQLEELSRTGTLTFVDTGDATEALVLEANATLSLTFEEDDIQLDEAEILRITGAKDLKKVKALRVPCMGYTSLNVSDLSRCVRLRELDISENSLRMFPRRLHLPRLRRLGLVGNRFLQLPLIEQFPQLTRLTMDDKYKPILNPQMLAYFCPRLKTINSQYFSEVLTEFTVRIIQEAKATVEPHIRSKWDAEFAERYQSVNLREERITILESLVKQLKDKNLLMDDTIGKYKDLMLYRFAEDYLKSKMCDPEDEMLAGIAGKKIRTADPTIDISDPEDDDEYEDEEEQDEESKAAGEAALFKSAEELLGNEWDSGYPMQTVDQSDPSGAGGLDPYQINLGRCLRQGKSVVMSIVRPRGVFGRPVAEFLPGELRNKDYVKGYMASEIYKKAVKDTLGQKGTPKKKSGPGRPRKSDQFDLLGMPKKRPSGGGPLNELNSSTPGGGMMGDMGGSGMMSGGRKRGRPTKAAQMAAAQAASAALGSGIAGLPMEMPGVIGVPPRPRKRASQGLHSLKDLYRNYSGYTNQPAASAMIDYDPLHFIRCHARDNDASDNETKVWRCLFEPNPNNPDETTHVVATCGGECVCLINCESGKVMKRFKHIDEDFYTIAWTTVEVEGGKRTNLLAAAGKLQEIRLLHPEQLVCYAEMKGHVEDISSMAFHQTQPTILFSGDSKASILVWDIGVPSVPDYKTRYSLLMRLRCPRLDVNPVLNLVFLPHYSYLLAGCEDGIFAWKITEFRSEKREREPDMELKIPSAKEVCFDGLAQLSENAVVVKCVEDGELCIFDFASVLERRKGLQRIVPIEIRGHLTWQKTDEIYINVSVRQNLGAVLCGDNEGSIWIYDLDTYLDDLNASSRKKFHVKPIKILEWPECSVQGNRDEDQQLKDSITSGFRNPVVNTVEMSSDGHFLAAVTDNNLVCIWRYTLHHLSTGGGVAAPVSQQFPAAASSTLPPQQPAANVVMRPSTQILPSTVQPPSQSSFED